MRWTGFKTKAFFSLGIYWYFWHRSVCLWLRNEVGITVTEQETWRLFIPIYNLVVWWKFLALIRQVSAGTLSSSSYTAGMKPLSLGRAFFWSTWAWFGGGPYVNRYLNAIDAFRRGQASVPTPAALAAATRVA
jgi:hypothetical protein